ncbi:MAG: DNA repair protein RecO [Bacteroidota bacterium]
MKQSDYGILLNRISYSENSLIATFFTEKSGIQKFIYLGGKKKSGNLFPLGIYELTYYKRPDSELGKLNQAVLDNSMNDIFFNPVKSVIAFFVAEILYQAIKSEEKDIELFSFINQEINNLENQKEVRIYPALFLLNFISHLGIKPHVEDSNSHYFDLEQGVFVTSPSNLEKTVHSNASEAIRGFLIETENYSELLQENAKEVVSILIAYLTIHLPNFKGQKSLEFAREILD